MSVITYKCNNCSGELTFDPQNQAFSCPYCKSTYTKTDLEKKEPKIDAVDVELVDDKTINSGENHEKESSPNEDFENFDAVLYNCPSCGAEVMTDSTTAATYCFYCHNPVVISGRLGGEFKPSRVIPFKFNKSQAVQKFEQWTRSKFFLPKDFFSEKSVQKLTGVYFPYWVIDCDARANLIMKGTKVRTWRAGDRRYTETSIYSVQRDGDIHLEDIIKTALSKSDKQLIESVQPFDSSTMEKFSMTYLSGFQAEKRDVEATQISDETTADVRKYCERLLTDTVIGYTTKSIQSSETNINKIDYEYCLLPVWVMTYKYKDVDYFFAMNGQSGKICGKLPVDKLKLFLCSSGISALIAVIIGIGGLVL